MLRGLVLASGAAANVVLALVVVDGAEVLGAGDPAWPLGRPRETPPFANIALVRRRLRLWMQPNVLVECIRLQRRNEALLLHAHLILLHWTRSSVIHAARIHSVNILEQVADHWLAQIRYSFVLHHVEGHRREHLAALPVILAIASLQLIVATLNARRRPVVRADALGHEVVLVRRRHKLLIEAARVHILVAEFEFLIVRNVILLPYVNHG